MSIDAGSNELEQHTINLILSKWEAPADAHERFRRWASDLARDLSPHANDFSDRVVQLKNEYRHLHEELARTLVQFGHVDEGLVSRRSFVAHLLDIVEPHMATVSTRHTFVRTAA